MRRVTHFTIVNDVENFQVVLQLLCVEILFTANCLGILF